MSEPTSSFRGPVFIVGMPRSGTKLLRGIINEHPGVAIPEIETEFLPFWVRKWNAFGDISDRHNFNAFYKSSQSLPFFIYAKEANREIDVDAWYKQCRDFSPASVFEALLRTHLKLTDTDTTIWGDKSPSYLTQLQLLRRLYPGARFIHIIRDVRDYCLSINKAWGKNILRAAQRWSDDVSHARAVGSTFGTDYLEIRYEDLLNAPLESVKRVCKFLDILFHEGLLELSDATENIGDAKGIRGIVEGNVRKYEFGLDSRTRLTIEGIAGKALIASGYDCEYTGKAIQLGPWRLRYFQILDGINLILFSARKRGVIGAVRFVSRYFSVSGNRQTPDA